MTPKEKADELFIVYVNEGMMQIKPIINRVIRKQMAKQCALIAVDEIIEVLYSLKFGNALDQEIEYYEEVKQEIEAL